MILLDVKQGSEEWIALRKTKITASDAAIILNESPFRMPSDLWYEKLGLIDPVTCNEKMKRGLELEPIARELYEEQEQLKFEPLVFLHEEHDWMMCSSDGVNLGSKKSIEIKCMALEKYIDSCNGKYPSYYYAQLQHQLACTGYESIDFVSFYPGKPLAIINVVRDQPYIDRMIIEEERFFKNLKELKEPYIYE